MDATPEGAEQLHRVKRGRPGPKPKVAAVEAPAMEDSKAQSHALRIWSGQSPDVPIAERVLRIVNGLLEQKLSLDIELPHPDAAKHLEKFQAAEQERSNGVVKTFRLDQ